MPWMLAGAALAPVLGGIIGNAASSGDRGQALDIQRQALANLQGVNTPDIEQLKIALEKYRSAGDIDPSMQDLIGLQDSKMNGIQTDPRLKDAQMSMLNKMFQQASGGFRPEDRAMFADIRNQTEADEASRREAMIQNMQQRGVGGSGAEYAANLISSQGAANRAGQLGLNIGAQANQAALQAAMNSGQLGGQMQAQEFSQKAQQAQAQDVVNRYNAMNSQQVTGQNNQLRNAAQAQNLANRQGIMNQNTQLSNQQEMYNKYLPQLDYQNKLGKAQAATGQSNQVAGAYNNNANATAGAWTGAGQALGQGAAAYGQYQQNDKFLDYLKNKNSPSADTVRDAFNKVNLS